METLRIIKRRARKEHICDTCGSKIYKGEEYDNQTNKFDGGLYTWKQCYHCKPITTDMFEKGYYPDGITDQDFQDYVSDHDIDFKRR